MVNICSGYPWKTTYIQMTSSNKISGIHHERNSLLNFSPITAERSLLVIKCKIKNGVSKKIADYSERKKKLKRKIENNQFELLYINSKVKKFKKNVFIHFRNAVYLG